MIRTCCGTDPNLLAEDRSPCACGLTFDDVERMVTYPHHPVRGGGLSIAEAVAREMGISPSIPMTDGQAAEFAERFKAAMADAPPFAHPVWLRPGLDRDEIRSLLRECVTVVKPGETLIIRVSENMTPSQCREYQQAVDSGITHWDLGFRAMVLPAEGLGIAEPAS
jgi:hypothetical protein